MRMRGLEPPPGRPDTDLNRARLPIPPHPRVDADDIADAQPLAAYASYASVLGAIAAGRPAKPPIVESGRAVATGSTGFARLGAGISCRYRPGD